MENSTEIVVIGAGVVGCSVAYYLAAAGANVVLLERDSIGSGSSAHATGFLSLLGAEFSPGPSFDLGLAGYHEFPQLVQRLEEETGMDLLFQRRTSLRLALEEDEENLIKEMMVWQQKSVDMKWIGAEEVRQIQPGLSTMVRGAALETESSQLDSYRLNLALGDGAERNGAKIMLRDVTGLVTKESTVTGVSTSAGDIACDMVVIAAGTWSSAFSQTLGFPIPVKALKGERLVLRYPGEPLRALISSPQRGHMISRLDGTLSVGSTGGRDYDRGDLFGSDAFDRQPTEAAKVELLQRAMEVFPDIERAELIQQLAGSRPLSADKMPIIGKVPGWQGVMLATGHTTKGIHLGPITGKIIANTILDGSPNVGIDLTEFLPDRFADVDQEAFYVSSQNVDE